MVIWLWVGFIALVVFLLALDLGGRPRAHELAKRAPGHRGGRRRPVAGPPAYEWGVPYRPVRRSEDLPWPSTYRLCYVGEMTASSHPTHPLCPLSRSRSWRETLCSCQVTSVCFIVLCQVWAAGRSGG